MGPSAPHNPPAPPASLSYAGNATGAPSSPDFSSEAEFGIRFLMKMWDDNSRTLFYQVGNSQDWLNFSYLSDYDIWRLPQADDNWDGCSADAHFICNRPVFAAGPAGSPISPNLAGRLAADFAVCYQLNRTAKPDLANRQTSRVRRIFSISRIQLSPSPRHPWVAARVRRAVCLLLFRLMDMGRRCGPTIWSWALPNSTWRFSPPAEPRICLPGLPHTNPMFYLETSRPVREELHPQCLQRR